MEKKLKEITQTIDFYLKRSKICGWYEIAGACKINMQSSIN